MKLFRAFFALAALCLASVALPAAAQTLSLPGPTDNNNQSVMFDITATNTVTVNGFVVRQVLNSGTFRVYARTGTHVGNQNSSAGWTLLATGSMSAGANVTFPTPFLFIIPAGQTGALYIASDSPATMGYRNGTGVGNVAAADANITAREGTGKNSPDFTGGNFQPRAFVGDINYVLGAVTVPTMTEWAMILFGVLLAGGAAVMIQRRRTVA